MIQDFAGASGRGVIAREQVGLDSKNKTDSDRLSDTAPPFVMYSDEALKNIKQIFFKISYGVCSSKTSPFNVLGVHAF